MHIRINLTINRAVQILLFYLFFVIASTGLFIPIFAIFIKDFVQGASLSTVGFALAFYAVAKSIIQVPLARYLDRNKGEKDDFIVLIIGAVIAVVYPFALLLVAKVWHLYLVEAMVGLGDAALMSAYYAIFARHVDKGSEGFEWSLFSVGTQTISLALGGAIGGIAADFFGFRSLFLFSGIINLFAVFILFLLYPYIDKGGAKSLPPVYTLPQ
ncbi:MAG: MFS transporter [bacterium]|nr:MFS transporter [bacterium]